MLPNFLILGAPRCGTTTLYETLKQHPQVFVSPVKEPMFFVLEGEKDLFPGLKSPQGPRDLGAYQSLFIGAEKAKAVGEASPIYLYSPKAASGIRKYIPDAKMIAILRNPVDRAYSHFLFHRLKGEEPIADLEEAMAAEAGRTRMGWFLFWSYRGMGFYGAQIERYFSLFDREQFCFFLFEDLLSRPAELFMKIFDFLGVEDRTRIRLSEKYNASGIPQNRFLHGFLTRPNILKTYGKRFFPEKSHYRLLTRFMNRNLAKPPLSAEVRSRILPVYREDILKTQDLIGRDLSSWLAA